MLSIFQSNIGLRLTDLINLVTLERSLQTLLSKIPLFIEYTSLIFHLCSRYPLLSDQFIIIATLEYLWNFSLSILLPPLQREPLICGTLSVPLQQLFNLFIMNVYLISTQFFQKSVFKSWLDLWWSIAISRLLVN